jgi:hypothetical protein
MAENKVIDTKDVETPLNEEAQKEVSVEKIDEARRISGGRLRLAEQRTFFPSHLITVLMLFLDVVFCIALLLLGTSTVFSTIESDTAKVILSIIGGIVGLLVSVGLAQFVRTKERQRHIKEIRATEKDFFEKVSRDLASRF